MLQSHLSSWFGVIICILAQNVKMQMTNLHMGILETRQDLDMTDVQSVESSEKKNREYYKLLQCSYALAALRHLQLTEGSVYNADHEFQYIPTEDYILFDAEAVSMLATVYNGTVDVLVCKRLRQMPLILWLYTDRVHRLLKAHSEGNAGSLNTDFMFKAHQYIKGYLRWFVNTHMGPFEYVKTKLNNINAENISSETQRIALMLTNKGSVSHQMAFNQEHGVSTDGKKSISFETLIYFDKLDKIQVIVCEYLGETYWNIVKNKLSEMYDAAMKLDVTITYQLLYLWHTKNGILKVLELILLKFIKAYVDLPEYPRKHDSIIISKLTEFSECLGISPGPFINLFKSSHRYSDFEDRINKAIEVKKNPLMNPAITNIENMHDYYGLLYDDTNMTISNDTNEWQNINVFIEKIKTTFSDVHVSLHSFEYSTMSQIFDGMKQVDYPQHKKKNSVNQF